MEESYYKKYEPIDGKWYIKELLGEGSYGKVFRIEREDISGKYTSALKIISVPNSKTEVDSLKESLGDEQSVSDYYGEITKKLMQEFQLMSSLKGNSNIVSYEDHDIKQHEDGIGYDILIRMELLTPLNKYFNNGINESDVIRLGIDICKALEICQEHNIIHRDIKPGNIFVSQNGTFKLGDFGVAKTMNNMGTVMTKAGTYTYMAPELYKGEKSSASVDIYSLGMVMYQLLNYNRDPFLPIPPEKFTFDQKEKSLIRRMRGENLPNPVQASEKLSKIILKACSFNSYERYESASEMRKALEKLDGNKNSFRVENIDVELPEEKTISVEYPETNDDYYEETTGIFNFAELEAKEKIRKENEKSVETKNKDRGNKRKFKVNKQWIISVTISAIIFLAYLILPLIFDPYSGKFFNIIDGFRYVCARLHNTDYPNRYKTIQILVISMTFICNICALILTIIQPKKKINIKIQNIIQILGYLISFIIKVIPIIVDFVSYCKMHMLFELMVGILVVVKIFIDNSVKIELKAKSKENTDTK